jgi:nucleoside-diphosphate-sugar epimerase
MKSAVIVGAQGVIGRYLVQRLAAQADWRVVGLSRRSVPDSGRVRNIGVDLLDETDALRKLSGLTDTTHIFYCAFQNRSTWAEQVAPNLAMLCNSVSAIARVAKGLQHVTLVQGTKYYGSHLGPFRTPAKESDPPHMPPNFYIDQQAWLTAAADGQKWGWTALRPHTILGYSEGSAMNLVLCIAAYAAISKALGLPLRFPGKPGAYTSIYQATDSALLARGMEWAATSPAARGQAFNLTNGDYFRWSNLWPRIAAVFEMEWAPPQTIRLADMMADKADLWSALAERHGLQSNTLSDLAAWPFADYAFACDWDIMSDTTKIRRAGFVDIVDSEQAILDLLTDLRRKKIVP